MNDFVLRDDTGGQKRFQELLALRFPTIAAQIDNAERGLLHLEMGIFAEATCAAIERGDCEEIFSHFAFIDELFKEAEPHLENAIHVSYLEEVFVGRNDQRYTSARSALSPRLRAALSDLEEHWQKIREWHQTQRPSD